MNPALLKKINLMKTVRLLICCCALFLMNESVIAQTFTPVDNSAGNGPRGTMISGPGNTMKPEVTVHIVSGAAGIKNGTNECGNIAFDPDAVRRCMDDTGEFVVRYTGFTSEAQAAFQYAVDIWSNVLNITVPIVIEADFSDLGGPVGGSIILGGAGANWINRDGAGYPLAGTWYPIALSNQFDGVDVVAGIPGDDQHINASFNSNAAVGWYFGLDGCPPAGQSDFVTVVLHEIGHGLGIFSSDFQFPAGFFGAGVGAGACYGFGGFPYIYDLFVESAGFGGNTVGDITPGPGCYVGLDAFYTSNDLTFTGPNTVACNGGPAPLFAPAVYQNGSSISHFDELSFPGVNENALMTPSVGAGEAVHDPGCGLALLQDLGYSVNDNVDGVRTVEECSAVPTMSEWGLMIFGLLVLNLGVVFLYRREEILASL